MAGMACEEADGEPIPTSRLAKGSPPAPGPGSGAAGIKLAKGAAAGDEYDVGEATCWGTDGGGNTGIGAGVGGKTNAAGDAGEGSGLGATPLPDMLPRAAGPGAPPISACNGSFVAKGAGCAWCAAGEGGAKRAPTSTSLAAGCGGGTATGADGQLIAEAAACPSPEVFAGGTATSDAMCAAPAKLA